jgi:hypothetical protein
MPFNRNSNFIGRGTQLIELKEKLFMEEQTTKIIITELGGIKKT